MRTGSARASRCGRPRRGLAWPAALLIFLPTGSPFHLAPGVSTSRLASRGLRARVASPLACGLPEPWAQHATAEGKTFFFNAGSSESVWELPASLLPKPWTQHRSEDGVAFFFNSETGESRWEFPSESTSSESPPPAPPPVSAAAPPSQYLPPVATPQPEAEVPASALDMTKARLLTLIRRLPGRGRGATQALGGNQPWEVEAVQTVVSELEPLDPSARDGWMVSGDWNGDGGSGGNGGASAPWVLRYSSSATFHRNDGLTGYAYLRRDCSTPELLMRVDAPRRGWVRFEEPIVRSGADGATEGDVSTADCLWTAGANDVLKLDARTLRADGREWTPRSPNSGDEVDFDAEKAIRGAHARRRARLHSVARACHATARGSAHAAPAGPLAEVHAIPQGGARSQGALRTLASSLARIHTCSSNVYSRARVVARAIPFGSQSWRRSCQSTWMATFSSCAPYAYAYSTHERMLPCCLVACCHARVLSQDLQRRRCERRCEPWPVVSRLTRGCAMRAIPSMSHSTPVTRRWHASQAVVPEILFVWTRYGVPDPPDVDCGAPAGADSDARDSAAILAAALAARDKAKGVARPSSGGIIPRYN